MSTPKKKTPKAKASKTKSTSRAIPMSEKERCYPTDLGMRWFHQGAHLPDDAHDTEAEDDIPAGRLRLTRTAPGGWGKAQ